MNRGIQVEIDFDAFGDAKGPVATPEQIARLVDALRSRDWTLRTQLEDITGLSDRVIRAAARAGRPRVVSWPGSPGYKLWEHCVTDELHRCMAGFRSQRDDMDESYFIYQRAFHSGYRGGDVTVQRPIE